MRSHLAVNGGNKSDWKLTSYFSHVRPMLLMLLSLLVLLMASTPARAQNWSGILHPSRAIDWRNVPSVTFTIPSSGWTQCGSTIAAPSSASAINSAISACGTNQYVQLGTGTFTLTSCIVGKSFVALRGNGPLNTIVKFTGNCSGFSGNTHVKMAPSSNAYDGSASVQPGGANALTITGTAGTASGGPTGAGLYPQGATQITVSNVGSDTPQVGTLLILDQANDTTPAAGWLQCSTNAGIPNACSDNDPIGSNGRRVGGVQYAQEQLVKITAINGSTYTISPGLYANNMRSARSPGAWWNFGSSLLTQFGIENLTLDHSGDTGIVSGIIFYDSFQCWLKNVRNIYGGSRNHIFIIQSAQGVIRDSYFFGIIGAGGNGGGYAIDPTDSSDFLIENNIFDQTTDPLIFENASGFVVGYNFSWNNQYVNPNWMQVTLPSHDTGSMMNLFEGNYFNGVSQDVQHGNSPVTTLFRNHIPGQQPVPYDKTGGTYPIELQALAHGINFIGNTFGMIKCVGGTYNGRPADRNAQCTGGSATGASYHLGYETSPGVGTANCGKEIYRLGWSGGGCSSLGTVANDAGVHDTMMRWGNYDTVTGTVRWQASEVPTTGSNFLPGNAVPGTQTLPASFYYNSKPSWYSSRYGNPPFPPVGPDVTGGDLAGLGGHAYRNPARLCYENTPQDSTNYPSTAIIAFDASTCYGTGSSDPPPAAPTGLTAVVR